MEQQASAAEFSLNVEVSSFLPGSTEAQDVRVRMETLVITSLFDTLGAFSLATETLY